ncbi:hypothetical protein J0H58_18360 [bacterium]|nr:hypothetical protein [bacterium]
MSGVIRLGEHEWPVRKATLGATILPAEEADFHWGPGTGGVSWSLDVEAVRRGVAGDLLAPTISVDSFSVPLRDWHEMAGRAFDWPNPPDTAVQDRPIICLYDHDDIVGCEARVGRRTGNIFDFELVGSCSFFTDADRLHVRARLTFAGVGVRAATPEAAWERLCERLDGRGFSPTPILPGDSWLSAPSYVGFEPLVT